MEFLRSWIAHSSELVQPIENRSNLLVLDVIEMGITKITRRNSGPTLERPCKTGSIRIAQLKCNINQLICWVLQQMGCLLKPNEKTSINLNDEKLLQKVASPILCLERLLQTHILKTNGHHFAFWHEMTRI
jgi:hypothetical protein